MLKKIFNFYIDASIHVAIATWALVQLTFHFFNITPDWVISSFVFFATIFGYNFVKYISIKKISKESNFFKALILLNFISISTTFFLFLKLKFITQILILIFSVLTFLYAIPLGKKIKNIRSVAGIKIYIVSFCWAGVTLLIPLVNSGYDLTIDIGYKFLQRFLITLILILIFEIKDSKEDDLSLKTVPQTIGVANTKKVILLLCIFFYFFEFFKIDPYPNQWKVNLILLIVILLFTCFASPNRSKYYTLFWVEAVPILWLVLFLLLKTN